MKMSIHKASKLFIFEAFVTFQLLFIGTSSIVASEMYPHIIGDFGIGICFGLAVFSGILFFGRFSTAHMNPAASLFAFLNNEINLKRLTVILFAQSVGALFASYLILQLAPYNSNLGTTFPRAGILNTWVIEFGLTFLLMTTIWIARKQSVLRIAIALGFIIFLEAWLGGPFTGASMNPIRSIAPAIFSGNLEHLWIYISAPFAAVLIVFLIIRKKTNN